MFISTGLSSTAASVLAFADQPVRAAVARVAVDTDLLPESACTGRESDKKDRIVFRSDDGEQAVVFKVPEDLLQNKPQWSGPERSVVRWSEQDYRDAMPLMTGIDKNCELVAHP